MPHDPASRPSHHLAPRSGWLNDPNGMTYRDGRWHVFYQHNPAGPFHNAIAWAHASSDDLMTWREHPVAFMPVPGGPDEFGCWSGVFVDGLDHPAVAYSGVVGGPADSTVCLRWGSDDLDTWSDPVVVAKTPTEAGPGAGGAQIHEMRDPFVLTLGDRRWALLGAGLTDGRPALLLFSCDDILAWRYEGVLATSLDLPGGTAARRAQIWECPQLVLTGTGTSRDVVLLVSIWCENRLDGVDMMTGTLALVDGLPRLTLTGAGPADLGDALYAPQVALDDDGPWLMGWIKEEGYPDFATDGSPETAGCMSFPRRLLHGEGGPSWVLDPRVVAGPGSAAGSSCTVSSPSKVVARGPFSVQGLALSAVGSDADLWFDGDVLEIYPHDRSLPSTHRDLGTASWQVNASSLKIALLNPTMG